MEVIQMVNFGLVEIPFPGFLYKKNVGVGGRRSTKFAAGGNITCNTYQYLYNKYKPGQGGCWCFINC